MQATEPQDIFLDSHLWVESYPEHIKSWEKTSLYFASHIFWTVMYQKVQMANKYMKNGSEP